MYCAESVPPDTLDRFESVGERAPGHPCRSVPRVEGGRISKTLFTIQRPLALELS